MTDGMRPEDWSTAAQQTLTLVEGLPPILYSTHLWTVGVVQSCSRGTGADSSFKFCVTGAKSMDRHKRGLDFLCMLFQFFRRDFLMPTMGPRSSV